MAQAAVVHWHTSAQYRQRMYDLFALYARPSGRHESVVCVDEKSKQLLCDTRAPAPEILAAVEPKGGRRTIAVIERRAKIDFVTFIKHLLEHVYPHARRIHLVLDNLNAHFRVCFEEVLGIDAARQLLRRVVFHHTSKHASWLNMAAIEIGILDRQCLDRRFRTLALLAAEVAAWQQRRPTQGCRMAWTCTRQDADRKMARHCVG